MTGSTRTMIVMMSLLMLCSVSLAEAQPGQDKFSGPVAQPGQDKISGSVAQPDQDKISGSVAQPGQDKINGSVAQPGLDKISGSVAQPGLDKIGTTGGVPVDHLSQVKEEEPVTTGSSFRAERAGLSYIGCAIVAELNPWSTNSLI